MSNIDPALREQLEAEAREGIYNDGQPLPEAAERGPDREAAQDRPENLNRRGRPLPNHDERYEWPTFPAYERRGNAIPADYPETGEGA